MASSATPVAHLTFIDGARAVLILWVVLFHIEHFLRQLPDPQAGRASQLASYMITKALSVPGCHGGLTAKLLAHPVLSGLGKYAFEVYLLHVPLLKLLTYGAGFGPTRDVLTIVTAVWIAAGLGSVGVLKPVVDALNRSVGAWAAGGDSARKSG